MRELTDDVQEQERTPPGAGPSLAAPAAACEAVAGRGQPVREQDALLLAVGELCAPCRSPCDKPATPAARSHRFGRFEVARCFWPWSSAAAFESAPT